MSEADELRLALEFVAANHFESDWEMDSIIESAAYAYLDILVNGDQPCEECGRGGLLHFDGCSHQPSSES